MGGFHSVPEVPEERKFGWTLKETASSTFAVETMKSGQTVVMLNQPLIRGVTCEMLYWWFRHFANIRVQLENVPDYEGKDVPAYFLWHPIDHIGAKLLTPDKDGCWAVGSKLEIQEVMQKDVYGTKYLVHDAMEMWYLKEGVCGGQGMGKKTPWGKWVLSTRICWNDVEGGVSYHYEVAVGLKNPGFFGRLINAKIAGKFNEEFMSAWQRHNVIEVGCFENFLPALYEQRDKCVGQPPWTLRYDAATMNSGAPVKYSAEPQPSSADPELVQRRMEEFRKAEDAVEHVRNTQAMGGPQVRW